MKQILLLVLFELVSCDLNCAPLATVFSIDNCIRKQTTSDTFYYYLNRTESCIPQCKPYNHKGYTKQKCPCPPGYVCDSRCFKNNKIRCTTKSDCPKSTDCIKICTANTNTCMAYHANTTDYIKSTFSALKFKPSCTNDGLWKPKQCKGGIEGRCFCFDAFGKRLFGEARYSESKDMSCACSRKKADLISSGRSYVSLHCDKFGNYEKLQCDSGLCWCADAEGGLTTAVIPQESVKKLPCYDGANGQYLRQCDSVTFANYKIEKLLKQHGVVNVNMGLKLCDGDGAYGAFNVSQGIAYCTWRDGTRIGSWQSDSSFDISKLNCQCARDYKQYSHKLTCLNNGNYQDNQMFIKDLENYFYCVDADGFQKSQVANKIFDDCSKFF